MAIRIQGEITTKITVDPNVLLDAAERAGVYSVFTEGMRELVDYLTEASPVGATGDLKLSWDYVEPRRERGQTSIRVIVTNKSQNAIYRVVGRGAGGMPPYQPIADWVIAKGIPLAAVYPIRRAIARRGTLRYRRQENFAGINPDGSLKPDSPIRLKEKEIADRIAERFKR
jgi:hypothetical protein